MPDHLIIFDTTLRDGEQSPRRVDDQRREDAHRASSSSGCSVDVIEARIPGFVERRLRRRCRRSRSAIKDSTVCALARANEQRHPARRRGAARPRSPGRVHTFIASSPIHMQMKLRMTPDQVLEQAVKSVKLGAQRTRTTSSSRPRTRAAPSRISCAGSLEAAISRGRDDHQHPGHRRLHDAVAVRSADRHRCASAFRTRTRPYGRCTATTISAWPSPTRSPR